MSHDKVQGPALNGLFQNTEVSCEDFHELLIVRRAEWLRFFLCSCKEPLKRWVAWSDHSSAAGSYLVLRTSPQRSLTEFIRHVPVCSWLKTGDFSHNLWKRRLCNHYAPLKERCTVKCMLPEIYCSAVVLIISHVYIYACESSGHL